MNILKIYFGLHVRDDVPSRRVPPVLHLLKSGFSFKIEHELFCDLREGVTSLFVSYFGPSSANNSARKASFGDAKPRGGFHEVFVLSAVMAVDGFPSTKVQVQTLRI